VSSSQEIKNRAAERRRTIEAAAAADRRATNADRTRNASDASTPNRSTSTPTTERRA
jgi:hypothetical protein